jgi:RNA polymerase sigma-70 factor (ECF subfamily)
MIAAGAPADAFKNVAISCPLSGPMTISFREGLMSPYPDDSELIRSAAAGDGEALASLWQRHLSRVRQMIRLRLDRRLQRRVDPSDVLQEAYIDLAERLPGYARERPMPIFLWIRLVAAQRLRQVHRLHLGTALRDVGREVSLHAGPLPPASSASLAAQLLGRFTSASQAAARAEQRLRLEQALNTMDAIDREIIALRHFEELSNGEAAHVLGLSKAAASKRYVRALTRLQSVLEGLPEFRGSGSG